MEKVWLNSYPKGIPSEIEKIPYASLAEFIEKKSIEYASLPAYSCMDKTLTYREIDQLSKSFSAYLCGKLKLTKGSRVAVMLPNILQYPVAIFGILRSGLTAVNVNPLYTARELEHQLKDSGAETIIILENFAHTLQEVLPKVNLKNVIVTGVGDLLDFPKSTLVNFAVRKIKKLVPKFNIPQAKKLTSVLKTSEGLRFKPHAIDENDLAFLQYTGGTTGISKGAMLSHGNLLANLTQAEAWINPFVEKGKEIVVTPLPLYHIFSLTANCLAFYSIGGHNILIPNPRDLASFVKDLKKYPFTALTGVNTLFNALLHNEEFCKLNFKALKFSLGGGSAVQKSVADHWLQVTGTSISQAYGLTETSPAVCMNPLNLREFNGSIGLPIPSTIISIRNDDNEEVPLGEPGELWVKGPQVMKGYWRRPEETQKTMTLDGWLKTGDVAVMDQGGFFTIVDRKKDMILVSGFNVYPNEIEEVIAKHKGVLESAAIGIPDEKSGEAVKVYAVRKDPSLTEKELVAHCRKFLTGYKIPKHIEFREDLPKTNVGKILRRSLKDMHNQAH